MDGNIYSRASTSLNNPQEHADSGRLWGFPGRVPALGEESRSFEMGDAVETCITDEAERDLPSALGHKRLRQDDSCRHSPPFVAAPKMRSMTSSRTLWPLTQEARLCGI